MVTRCLQLSGCPTLALDIDYWMLFASQHEAASRATTNPLDLLEPSGFASLYCMLTPCLQLLSCFMLCIVIQDTAGIHPQVCHGQDFNDLWHGLQLLDCTFESFYKKKLFSPFGGWILLVGRAGECFGFEAGGWDCIGRPCIML